MATKIITLDSHFATGEPTVQIISTWGRDGRVLREHTSLEKRAAHSPAEGYMRTVQPEPGKTIVLVIGLGDSETYGPNRNGDSFPSEPVKGKIASDEVLTKHYKSYEKAHVFKHHANSDPAKSVGRVKQAFWNPYMRRVELIEDFDNKKAPELLEKIAAGEYPAKSMGCHCAGTQVTTPTGYKNIEDIEVDDTVLSHLGAWRRVTELHRRPYYGRAITLHTSQGKTTATDEHPIAVLHSRDVVRSDASGYRKRPDEIDLAKLAWVPASEVTTDMYLVSPWATEVQETLTVAECRLLGYYVAEGWVTYGRSPCVGFSHNVTDALLPDVTQLTRTLGLNEPTTNGVSNSALGRVTYIRDFSRKLPDFCVKHAGKYAQQKCLSLELLTQPREQQLAFLGAVINGDGGVDCKGDFYISTCNNALAVQYQQVGFRCGLYSRIQIIRHKPSRIVTKDTVEYRVSFPRRCAALIAPYTVKVKAHKMKSASTGPLQLASCVLSKVKAISAVDIDATVYNLEIEVDNSYVANGHAVHNCRIKYDVCSSCGNKAKTRSEYCDHLKYAMSEVDPRTGVKNAALNPSPDFFDSSWVMRPADRTGFMMKKVARDDAYELRTHSFDLGELAESLKEKSAALAKAADIEKILAGAPAASVSNLTKGDAALVKKYQDTAPKASKDRSGMVQIMISYKPSEAMGTADDAGLPLGIKDLIKYFLGRMSPGLEASLDSDKLSKAASDHLGLLLETFATYPRFLDDTLKTANLTQQITNLELAHKLANYEQTPVEDYVRRRTTPNWARPDERGLTDLVSWTDPNTMQRYDTTYGNVQRTNDALVEHGLLRNAATGLPLLGGSALLGAATLGMGLSPKTRGVPQVIAGLGALGLGVAGAHQLTQSPHMSGPKIRTDQGDNISGWTEMVPKRASYDAAPELQYLTKRASDQRPSPLPPAVIAHYWSLTKSAEVSDEQTPVVGVTLNFEKMSQLVGQSLLAAAK